MPFSPDAYRLGSGLAVTLGLSNGYEVARALRFANNDPNAVIAALKRIEAAKSPIEKDRRKRELERELLG